MDVTIVNRQRARRVNVRELRGFLRDLERALPPGSADRMAVCLVSDDRMRRYNRDHRGKDTTTDVLSFPASPEPDPEGGRHLGDIVISVPTAARQAAGRGSLSRELRLLLLHGYLHLLGHDHETDGGVMRHLETRLARRLLPARRERR